MPAKTTNPKLTPGSKRKGAAPDSTPVAKKATPAKPSTSKPSASKQQPVQAMVSGKKGIVSSTPRVAATPPVARKVFGTPTPGRKGISPLGTRSGKKVGRKSMELQQEEEVEEEEEVQDVEEEEEESGEEDEDEDVEESDGEDEMEGDEYDVEGGVEVSGESGDDDDDDEEDDDEGGDDSDEGSGEEEEAGPGDFVLPTEEEEEAEAQQAPDTAALNTRVQEVLRVLVNFRERRAEGTSRGDYMDRLTKDLAKIHGCEASPPPPTVTPTACPTGA